MFSKTCEYAIRATIFIATQSYQNKRARINDIAEKINSPRSFTAKILQLLVKNNIVHSIKGVGGGFEIPKDSINKITLAQIVTAMDGDGIYKNCSLGVNHCSETHPCPLYKKFQGIRNEIGSMLVNTNLEELALDIYSGESFLK